MISSRWFSQHLEKHFPFLAKEFLYDQCTTCAKTQMKLRYAEKQNRCRVNRGFPANQKLILHNLFRHRIFSYAFQKIDS